LDPTFSGERGTLDASGHSKGWTAIAGTGALPDPDQFLVTLHADGLKTSLNLHPASGIQPWEDRYNEIAKAMGVDPATKQYIPSILPTSACQKLSGRHPSSAGEAGHRLLVARLAAGARTKLPAVTPTWWLNYVHFTESAA